MEPCDRDRLQTTYTYYEDFHLWKITLLELSLQQTNLRSITYKLRPRVIVYTEGGRKYRASHPLWCDSGK